MNYQKYVTFGPASLFVKTEKSFRNAAGVKFHLWIPVIKCNKNPYAYTRWLVMTLFQTDRCVQALFGPSVTFQGFPSDRRHLAVTTETRHGPLG